MQKSARLLTFNASDKEVPSVGDHTKQYTFQIQMFGITEKGETMCIFVDGYQPFFWVKVPDNWGEGDAIGFKSWIEEKMGTQYADHITQCKVLERKKLYGFDGERYHNFVLLKFRNMKAFNRAKNLWFVVNKGVRRLSPKGLLYEHSRDYLQLYEANIPPLLRYFHIQEISPSGWVAVPLRKATKHTCKSTTCKYEYTIAYNKLIPLPNKETPVPYKICSFDIEASSSHGDFPLPIKNYRKLSENIVDACNAYNRSDSVGAFDQKESCAALDMVSAAFGYGVYDGIDRVFPKRQPDEEWVLRRAVSWLETIPALLANSDEDSDYTSIKKFMSADNDDSGEEQSTAKGKQKREIDQKQTVFDVLSQSDQYDRETIIIAITRTLDKNFPPLEGDKVTFIGSTFMLNGESKPYLSRCDVLDTCDDLPAVENSKIVCHSTESKLLTSWASLIRNEDPDIIIGYNIFGFDYDFMFKRSLELECYESFLQMSRNKNEKCFTRDWKTGKIRIEESSIVIASGQHDLRYVHMDGRLQIDLYNYFRRDYNLTSYKLDYVAGHFIGDKVSKITHLDGNTIVKSKNLTGLELESWIAFEEISHTSDFYNGGEKMCVIDINRETGEFVLRGEHNPNMTKKVKWGLAKDDVSPQDIFRMTNGSSSDRAVIAKYCLQDCNLVHHLLRKIDVITGFVEMAKLCSVPMSFLVLRGQGIKLTSYIAKKCREKNTLLPVIDKGNSDEGYEGAIVLDPKSGLYLDKPVACVDYSSLYPSSMISENISHDSKVWTREFDLEGNLLCETGTKNSKGEYIYDNLPEYAYVDIEYDTYSYIRKSAKAAAVKTLVGKKICRFAQYPKGRAVMPSILEELLAARKATRKQIPNQTDDFMKNVLDKRQLSIKITANSLYGQTGATTSSFFEKDIAASTTAVGRKLLKYAKRVIENVYADTVVEIDGYGTVRTRGEYVYGDTDSVFFTYNFEELDGTPIVGQRALEMTILLAQKTGELATKFLKKPHDLEYEKTFMPFCLLSKKRYVGMLYETDPHSCYRKEMGIVLKRRDNAPVVKDVYGGIIDILMKDNDIGKAVEFLKSSLQDLIDGKLPIDKLVITKSLRGNYKNPAQIAHKVLADRMGKRDPGNKPASGDRIPYAYIQTKGKMLTQGEKIEHPAFITANKLKLDYTFYITNQIMKPVLQLFALVLERLPEFRRKRGSFKAKLETLRETLDEKAYARKEATMRDAEAKAILFEPYLRQAKNTKENIRPITSFFS